MALEKIVIPDNETPEQKEEKLRKEKEEAEAKAKLETEEEAKRKAEEEEAAKKKAEEEAKLKTEDGNNIEIDGIVYSLDENGNAVDSDGNIKFTKEQIASMEEETDDNKPTLSDNYIDAISKLSGIIIKDEKGNDIKYDSTVEGFAKRESDIKALGEKEGFEKGFNKYLAANPDIASIIEYKNKFGTIEGYSANKDFSKVEIIDDEELLKDLIYKAEIQKGTSPERAKRIVEFAKANNTLKDDATESLEWLRKHQADEIAAIKAKEEADYKAEIEKEIKFYGVSYEDDGKVKIYDAPGSLYDLVVVKGQIGEYAIPQEGLRIKTNDGEKLISRQELFDYFSRPIKEINGMVYSQAQLDEIVRLSNPAELAMRFIMNLNGGVEQLIKTTIAKQEVKRLKSMTSKPNRNNGIPKRTTLSKDDKIVLPIK